MAMVFNPKDPRTCPKQVVHDCGRILDFLSECFTWGTYGEERDISADGLYGLWALLSGVSEVLIEASEIIKDEDGVRENVETN